MGTTPLKLENQFNLDHCRISTYNFIIVIIIIIILVVSRAFLENPFSISF
jgi:hypothetical protein